MAQKDSHEDRLTKFRDWAANKPQGDPRRDAWEEYNKSSETHSTRAAVCGKHAGILGELARGGQKYLWPVANILGELRRDHWSAMAEEGEEFDKTEPRPMSLTRKEKNPHWIGDTSINDGWQPGMGVSKLEKGE
jgi:hypothetical protein